VGGSSRTQLRYSSFASAFRSRLRTNLAGAPANLDKRKRELAQREWKRDLSTRPNGTIDPWYGCDLFDFVIDYALNYTYPWTNNTPLGFDVGVVIDSSTHWVLTLFSGLQHPFGVGPTLFHRGIFFPQRYEQVSHFVHGSSDDVPRRPRR